MKSYKRLQDHHYTIDSTRNMIDVCQWRASIGAWIFRQNLCTRGSTTSSNVSQIHSRNNKTCAIAISLFLLLALSGDIEPNPGPKTGIFIIIIILDYRLYCMKLISAFIFEHIFYDISVIFHTDQSCFGTFIYL